VSFEYFRMFPQKGICNSAEQYAQDRPMQRTLEQASVTKSLAPPDAHNKLTSPETLPCNPKGRRGLL
jgi:hypothetical protein